MDRQPAIPCSECGRYDCRDANVCIEETREFDPAYENYKPTGIAQIITDQAFIEKKLETLRSAHHKTVRIMERGILRCRWLRECHRCNFDVIRLALVSSLYAWEIDWEYAKEEDINEMIEVIAMTPMERWNTNGFRRGQISLVEKGPHEKTEALRDALIYFLANLWNLPRIDTLGKKCEAPAGVYDDPFQDD